LNREFALLVGTTKGVFCFWSDQKRCDWQMTGPHLPGWEVYSLLGDSRQGLRMFAGTHHQSGGATIQVSDDFGQTWAPVEKGPCYPRETGFQLNRFWQLAAGAPAEPETVYAGAEEAGLFVSRDRGETWEEVSGLTQHPTRPGWGPGAGGMGLHTILVHPTNPRRMWVAMSAVGVFRTDDGGENWKVCNNGLARVPTGQPYPEVGYCAHKVTLDPQDANTLYMQDHGGVNKSTDGADSWFRIEEGLGQEGDGRFGFPIAVAPSGELYLVPLTNSEHRVVRGGKLVIYRSDNRGQKWEPVRGDFLPTTQYVNVLRDGLAVDPLDPHGVYFGTSSGELFYSLDRGDHWDSLPGRFPRITTVKTWVLE
jgi:BNR/Asp-box repeat